MGLRKAAELRQHLQGGLHRARGKCLAVETAGAETDHVLLAVDDLERQIGTHPNDDHVQRVRADVDGGKAHGAPTLRLELAGSHVQIGAVLTGHKAFVPTHEVHKRVTGGKNQRVWCSSI
jgi:hypothetical protein